VALCCLGASADGSTRPAGAPIAECPLVQARYAASDNQVTARFHAIGRRPGWRSDVALGVRSAPGRPEHWFLFDRGAARRINLISTTDVTKRGWQPPSPDGGARPLGEMTYLAADARKAVIAALPTSASPAPRLIVLPELPEVLARRASPAEDATQPILSFVRCAR
jgi:hypothetical protein